MPVERCNVCKRGKAGYLDSEKSVTDLTSPEIQTEKAKYEAKIDRIEKHIAALKEKTVSPSTFPLGKACPGCQQGWREFKDHQKDLEQLTIREAGTALNAARRDHKKLTKQEAKRGSPPKKSLRSKRK